MQNLFKLLSITFFSLILLVACQSDFLPDDQDQIPPSNIPAEQQMEVETQPTQVNTPIQIQIEQKNFIQESPTVPKLNVPVPNFPSPDPANETQSQDFSGSNGATEQAQLERAEAERDGLIPVPEDPDSNDPIN